MFAYLVPNKKDVPTLVNQYGPFLKGSRVSVDAVEKALGGANLFANAGLSSAEQAKLEADSTSPIVVPDIQKYSSARTVWG